MDYDCEVAIAKWLMSRGYSAFDFGDQLWMEEYVRDHSWRDVIDLLGDFAANVIGAHRDAVQHRNGETCQYCHNGLVFVWRGSEIGYARCEKCGGTGRRSPVA